MASAQPRPAQRTGCRGWPAALKTGCHTTLHPPFQTAHPPGHHPDPRPPEETRRATQVWLACGITHRSTSSSGEQRHRGAGGPFQHPRMAKPSRVELPPQPAPTSSQNPHRSSRPQRRPPSACRTPLGQSLPPPGGRAAPAGAPPCQPRSGSLAACKVQVK